MNIVIIYQLFASGLLICSTANRMRENLVFIPIGRKLVSLSLLRLLKFIRLQRIQRLDQAESGRSEGEEVFCSVVLNQV